MKQNKRIIILAGLLLAILAGLLIAVLKTQGGGSSRGGVPLTITSILPSPNPQAPFIPVQQIQVTFSSPVGSSGIKYSVTPQVDTYLVVNADGTIVTISPKTVWKEGTTTITIQSDTQSTAGQPLGKPSVYRFTAAFPGSNHPLNFQENFTPLKSPTGGG